MKTSRKLCPALILIASVACTSQGADPSAPPSPSTSGTSSPGAPSHSPHADAHENADLETVYETAADAAACGQPDARVVPPIEGAPLNEQVQTIARAVELVRDLEFTDEPTSRLLPPDEFKDKSRSLVGDSYSPEQARADAKILAWLGLIPKGTDLLDLQEDVAGEQIGGFYLPREKTLYVPSGGEDLSPYDEIVVAHELEHALADSALDLPKLSAKDPAKADESTGTRALVEGDATLLMQQYAAVAFTPEDAQELLSDPALTESAEDAEDVPFIIQRSLEFPYTEGLYFVCRLFQEDGWKTVNRAYKEPPVSTAQILLPELYDDHVEPVKPPRIGDPGKGWGKPVISSLGMFDLAMTLQAPGGEQKYPPEEGLDRAKEWTGGEMSAWINGGKVAVILALSVDSSTDGEPELCAHLREWHEDSFGPVEEARKKTEFRSDERYTIIDCDQRAVRLAMAPSKLVTKRLLKD